MRQERAARWTGISVDGIHHYNRLQLRNTDEIT